MAYSTGPDFSFYYTDLKSDIAASNTDIENGALWFCDQDRTFGLKLDSTLKEFGSIGTLIENNVNNSQGILDCIRIVSNSSQINTSESKNVLYFCTDEKSVHLVYNNPLAQNYVKAG